MLGTYNCEIFQESGLWFWNVRDKDNRIVQRSPEPGSDREADCVKEATEAVMCWHMGRGPFRPINWGT